jgi:hypothetical protein
MSTKQFAKRSRAGQVYTRDGDTILPGRFHLSDGDIPPTVETGDGDTVPVEAEHAPSRYETLVAAWDAAGPADRERFLETIGARRLQ